MALILKEIIKIKGSVIMRLLKGPISYLFIIILIAISFIYRDSILLLYNYVISQQDSISQILDSVNKVMTLFQ